MKSSNRTGCVWCGEAMRDGEAVVVANVGALCGDCLRKWRAGQGEPVEVKHMGSTGLLLEKAAWKAEAKRRGEELEQLRAEVAGLRAERDALLDVSVMEGIGDRPAQRGPGHRWVKVYRALGQEFETREDAVAAVRAAAGLAPSGPGGGLTV